MKEYGAEGAGGRFRIRFDFVFIQAGSDQRESKDASGKWPTGPWKLLMRFKIVGATPSEA